MSGVQSSRREFLQRVGVSAAAVAASSAFALAQSTRRTEPPPSYLKEYASQYAADPRAAAHQWFSHARFGLFLHYGLYSLTGKEAWVQYREKIPVEEYAKLKDRFTAAKFDADFITDLALAAQMRYVNITTRHHDGFCLWPTATTDFHTGNSPLKRDLVGELAEQCRRKGLGLFLYHSYGLSWRDPWFFARTQHCPAARPAYDPPEQSYRFEKDEDFAKYIATQHQQLRELLTNYGPIAGIWFDPLMCYYCRPELFRIEETYRLIRQLQPQTLISFKQGATGTEDFAAPERGKATLADNFAKRGFDATSVELARKSWDSNKQKHNEICDTLQDRGWANVEGSKHRPAEWVLSKIAAAHSADCNLLLNTGPLGDGSIHPDDTKTLRGVGAWISANGWPTPQTHPAGEAGAPDDAVVQ